MTETYKVIKKETNKYIVKVVEQPAYKIVLKEIGIIQMNVDGGEY